MTNRKTDGGATTASVPTPLDALRNATSDYHGKLEAAIDWMGAFESFQAYRDLLERFARVVPPLEVAIAQQLACTPPPDFEPGVRTAWLESDLAAMTAFLAAREPRVVTEHTGLAPSSETRPSLDFSYIDSASAAIGALYVLEGSSLGGQFLSRQLQERLQLTAAEGGAYFNGYGANTGKHWQAFRHWANEQLVRARGTPCAVEAAKLTFARFGEALAGLAYE